VSTATAARPQSQSPTVLAKLEATTGGELLEAVIDKTVAERQKAMTAWLDSNIHAIESLLPRQMRGQGARLAKRAILTFARQPEYHNIQPKDFIRCVLEAAEFGFAIDNKMAYVVKYKSVYQCQFDYKALIAVAKRQGLLRDIDVDLVRANDTFEHRRSEGLSVLLHTYDLSKERGEVIGAYCRMFLPDGTWTYELMQRAELDAVKARAPSQNGPWKSDPGEMQKKTVIRRGLKRYKDDPSMSRMLDLDIDREYDAEDESQPKPMTMAELAKLMDMGGAKQQPHQQSSQSKGSRAPINDDVGPLPEGVAADGEILPFDSETAETRFAGCQTDKQVDALVKELTDLHPDQDIVISTMGDTRKQLIEKRNK
jgi:phage RecT family recombinase